MSSGWKEYRAYLGLGMKRYQARVRAAAPAPHDETEAYRRFSAWFMPLAFVLSAAPFYLAAVLNVDGSLLPAESVERAIPQAADRIAFLAKYDTRSPHAYMATLAAGLVIVPVFLVANAIGYWKMVVAPGACRNVKALSGVSVIYARSCSRSFT